MIQEQSLAASTISLLNTQNINSIEEVYHLIISEKFNPHIESFTVEIQSDLVELFMEYIESSNDRVKILKMPIHLLAIYENMSQRIYNISMDAGFTNLYSLIEFGYRSKSYQKLRNCGQIANEEFLKIFKKYKDLYELSLTENKNTESDINEFFDTRFYSDLSLEALALNEPMSMRSYNVCKNAGLNTLGLILRFYRDNNESKFLFLRNSGYKTNKELVNICQKYENLMLLAKWSAIGVDSKLQISNFLAQLKIEVDYDIIIKNIGEPSGIPFFKILELLIDNKKIFKKNKEVEVFRNCFNFYLPNTNYTLQEIGNELGITRERVRQIRNDISKRIRHAFKVINHFPLNNLQEQYNISYREPYIFIDSEKVSEINSIERTKFSAYFITFILSIILNKSHLLFGDLDLVLSNRIFNKYCSEKNIYLISRQILSVFNLKKMLLFLKTELKVKRKKNVRYNFGVLLNKFAIKHITKSDDMINIIKLIIINDFSDVFDVDNEGIVYKRKIEKNTSDYVIEILEKSNIPLHYTEIYQNLISSGVKVKSVSSLHAMLTRNNQIFGLKGPGMFDLRSKGGFFGTIGDVAYQYLLQQGGPIHFKDVESLICQELTVSKHSIGTVLFNYNNENRFIRDKNGYVHLRSLPNSNGYSNI